MRFLTTNIAGVYKVELESHSDKRGHLAEAFVAAQFKQIPLTIDRCIISHSDKNGTIRGMHYQVYPKSQIKLVYCIKGRVLDVAVDVRRESPTYRQYVAIELTEDNKTGIYVPEMCAHGWQALTDDAKIMYLVQGDYSPADECGLRYDDPSVGIKWPLPIIIVSDKDLNWPLLNNII